MNKTLILMSFVFFTQYAVSQEINIQQREGLIQNQEDKHIVFRDIDKIKSFSESGILGHITKMNFSGEHIYILDKRQSKIFVFNKEGKLLYSIGRPGQGPGDLENPSDFFISDKEIVYVLNPSAKRIEVFSIKGKFIKRIALKLPEGLFYSQPKCILVDQNQEILIAYSLSPHLIDAYDENGNYLRTLLKRDDKITIPGENIGNCSQIQFLPKERAILHFNYFTGLFTKIAKTGKVERQFSVFDKPLNKEISTFENKISASVKPNNMSVSVIEVQLWSLSCIDEDENIYASLLVPSETEKQRMFSFSPNGDYLYRKNTPDFAGNRIRVEDLYYFKDSFIFKTPDNEIYLAKKGENK